MHYGIKVFVYGTLRRDEYNHRLMLKAKIRSTKCWTNGRLYDTGFGYPAMVQDPAGRVYGELYQVTEEQLAALDDLEGYRGAGGNNEYERVRQAVYTEQGEETAYVYVYPPQKAMELGQEIISGDWKRYNLKD